MKGVIALGSRLPESRQAGQAFNVPQRRERTGYSD